MTTLGIMCDISLLDSLINTAKDMKLGNFMIIDRVLGKLPQEDLRLDTAIWPGYNAMIICFLPEEKALEMISTIEDMNSEAITNQELVYWFQYSGIRTNLKGKCE